MSYKEIQKASQNSASWFLAQVQSMRRDSDLSFQGMMSGDTRQQTTRITPGMMYLYNYDPKTKKTLPIYDIYPLVIPWRAMDGGFIGLNIHYLPLKPRIQLLSNMLEFATSTRLGPNTKLQFTWQMINNAAKYDPVKVCVKQYLLDHVRSPFRKIESPYWASAALLPVARFKKGGG